MRSDNRADSLAVGFDGTGDEALLMHRGLDLTLFLPSREVEHRTAAYLVEEHGAPDLEGGSWQPLSRTVGMVCKKLPEALQAGLDRSESGQVQLRVARMIDVDPYRSGNRLGHLHGRMIQVVEAGLQGEHLETEVGQALRASPAHGFALADLTLIGDVTGQNHRTDDLATAVLDRCGLEVDDAIVIAPGIMNQIVRADHLASERAHGWKIVCLEGRAVDVAMPPFADAHLGLESEEPQAFPGGGRVHALQPSRAIINCCRFGNLVEDRADLGHFAHGSLVQKRVVQGQRCIATDLGEQRDFGLRPPPACRACVHPERPRLVLVCAQQLNQLRLHSELLGQRRIEIRIFLHHHDRFRRVEQPVDQPLRSGQRDRPSGRGGRRAIRRGHRETDRRHLGLLVDRVKEPRCIRVELLLRHRHNPAQHLPQIERSGE